MKQVELKGTLREPQGKSAAQAERRSNRVPCVLYGGKENVHFSVERLALERLIHTPLIHSIELDIDGVKRLVLLKAKQFHPVSDAVIHADFLEVDPDQEVDVTVSLRLKGQSVGVRQGGVLQNNMRKVRLKGKVDALPEVLVLDVSELEIGQAIRVSDIEIPGVTFMEDAEEMIVSVKRPRRVVEEVPVAEAAEEEGEEAAEEGAEEPEGEKAE